MAVSNFELFEAFVVFIREHDDIDEILREYGGSQLYIPSYKTVSRNDNVIEDFLEGMSIPELRRKYDLSSNRIYEITREVREPKLF